MDATAKLVDHSCRCIYGHVSVDPIPNPMILRDYQRTAVTRSLEALAQDGACLCVMPTGTGKTIVFASLLESLAGLGRGMVIAHREELISQAVDKIERATDLETDVEMADLWASELRKAQVIVSTIQTQNAGRKGKRMHRFTPRDFGLLVIDEAHHATADSYVRVIDYYRTNPALRLFGVTATPDRHDEIALGKVFDSVPYVYEIIDAIRDGWLVPVFARPVVDVDLDFSNVRTTAGDLNGGDLARIMEAESALQQVTTPAFEIAAGRKTLVFAASVFHAEKMAEIFNRHQSGCARFVCGKTPKDERRTMMRDYHAGKFSMLCNVGVATEGFDVPGIECVVMARPTKSRALYAQMCGRGTRPLTGIVDDVESSDDRRRAIAESAKPHVDIVDFVGVTGRHKLIYATDILGGNYSDDVVARAWSDIANAGAGVDTQDALDRAQDTIAKEHAIERRKRIIAKASYKVGEVDVFDVLDITPWREPGWHKGRPPTEKMLALLKRKGVAAEYMTFTQARQAIGNLIERSEAGLCTYKQARVLTRNGIDASNVTFQDASKKIDELSKAWAK